MCGRATTVTMPNISQLVSQLLLVLLSCCLSMQGIKLLASWLTSFRWKLYIIVQSNQLKPIHLPCKTNHTVGTVDGLKASQLANGCIFVIFGDNFVIYEQYKCKFNLISYREPVKNNQQIGYMSPPWLIKTCRVLDHLRLASRIALQQSFNRPAQGVVVHIR